MDEWTLRRHIAAVLRVEGTHGFRAELGSLDDTGELQTITAPGFAGEEVKNVHRVQPHGFASNPPLGSHGIVVPLGGERILSAALGFEHPDYRQKNLPAGTAVLYDDQGNCIRAYGTNGIQVAAAKGNVSVTPEEGKFVFLGGDGTDGDYAFVQTMAGPSTVVKAKL